MSSWVYVFSKFTPEALLFEALIICILLAGYAAFWILRKRRYGVIQQEVPAGVVKGYLNELIVDAEQMRAQLFGLLAASGVEMPQRPARVVSYAAAPAASDSELAHRLAEFEAKMAEQSKAIESLLSEKTRIEQELAAARASGGGGGAAGPDPQVPKLHEKIALLEGRLAEYSVIEDDLANLKRLQQENAQLKAALGQGGASAGTIAAAAPAAATTPTPTMAAAPKVSAPTPAMAPAAPAADPNFENLVDQVEQSLQPAAASAAPAEVAAAPAASPLDEATSSATLGKSDEDLVAEFEKMLNS